MLRESAMLPPFLALEAKMTRCKDKQFGEKAQATLLDDEHFLPQILESYLRRVLEREMASFPGAEAYARTEGRRGYRNGYNASTLRTRVWGIKLLVPRSQQGVSGEGRREVFNAYDLDKAKVRLEKLIGSYRESYPKLADTLHEHIEQTNTGLPFPLAHGKKVRATNDLERFNQEIARQSKVVRAFRDDKARIRLVAALAMEQSEGWLTAGRLV